VKNAIKLKNVYPPPKKFSQPLYAHPLEMWQKSLDPPHEFSNCVHLWVRLKI
jgi:hypothetical protein